MSALKSIFGRALQVFFALVFLFSCSEGSKESYDQAEEKSAKKEVKKVEKETTPVDSATESVSEPGEKEDTQEVEEATQGYEAFLKELEGNSITIQEKLDLLKTKGQQYIAESSGKIDELTRYYSNMLQKSASLEKESDFVTCKGIVEKNPSEVSEKFGASDMVYFWAKVNAPKDEVVKLEVRDPNGSEILLNKYFEIKADQQSGFRVYYYKAFHKTGQLEARLYNGQKELIANTTFQLN